MRMTIETNRDWHAHWTSVGQRTGKDELFRQVERTVGGMPVLPEQIELVVGAIKRRLNLSGDDVLLDLCCGNGLITARLSPQCQSIVGTDYSCELIQVARERSALPNIVYLHRAADDLRPTDFPMGAPTKVCMNAGLQYFTERMVGRLLHSLQGLVQQGLALYITDVPDAGKIEAFYNTPERWVEFERRRAVGTEAIGTWWDRDHLRSIIEKEGCSVSIIDPESDRFTAHYRFDVLAHISGNRF
jgi:SAM-dependent methyltransferase